MRQILLDMLVATRPERTLYDAFLERGIGFTPRQRFRLHAKGFRHVDLPIHGVQFHPESIATEHGHALIANFLRIAGLTPAALPDRVA